MGLKETGEGNGVLRWVVGLVVGVSLSLAGGAFGYTQARIARLEDTCVTQRELGPQLEAMRRDMAEIKQLVREMAARGR